MKIRYLANRNKRLVAERVDTEVSFAPDARAMFAMRRQAIEDGIAAVERASVDIGEVD